MPPAGRDYHHGDLRRALLAAAAGLIAADGVQAASLREVARRAGVSHAAPAHHFGDKAGLLAALAAEGHALLADRLATCADLRAGGDAYLAVATGHPGHFAVMTRCDLADPAVHPALAEAGARSFGELQRIARATAGDADPGVVADAAWGLAHGLAVLAAAGALGAPDQARARVAAAMDLLCSRLRRPTSSARRP